MGEMCCLLRHVLHRSVAFKSIIQRGHFPLFSQRSSIFHLRTTRPVHWGMEFDFKIHWKQLAPSLPSPFLFHLPLNAHSLRAFTLQCDLRGLFCWLAEPGPKTCNLIVINQRVLNHCRAQNQMRKPDEINDKIRNRKWWDYRGKSINQARQHKQASQLVPRRLCSVEGNLMCIDYQNIKWMFMLCFPDKRVPEHRDNTYPGDAKTFKVVVSTHMTDATENVKNPAFTIQKQFKQQGWSQMQTGTTNPLQQKTQSCQINLQHCGRRSSSKAGRTDKGRISNSLIITTIF